MEDVASFKSYRIYSSSLTEQKQNLDKNERRFFGKRVIEIYSWLKSIAALEENTL